MVYGWHLAGWCLWSWSGIEGTLFATLMSVFNGAGTLGSELGALLTSLLGVTEKDFGNLGPLIAICNLSSLLSLPLLPLIGAVDQQLDQEQQQEQGGADGPPAPPAL